MTITLENVSVYIGIILFAVGVVRVVLVVPIKESIATLAKCIEKLEKNLCLVDEKLGSQRERIIMVEASASQAHKRIDRLDHLVDAEKQIYD